MCKSTILGQQQEKNNIWSFRFISWESALYLPSVGHQWRDLTFDWQVCSILQTVMGRTNSGRLRRKKQNEWQSNEKGRGTVAERNSHEFLPQLFCNCDLWLEFKDRQSELHHSQTQPVISPQSRNRLPLEENRWMMQCISTQCFLKTGWTLHHIVITHPVYF